jgi:NADPH-dependent curcumin reductase CurA
LRQLVRTALEPARHILPGAGRPRESVAEVLRDAPATFTAMLSGKNFGKAIVKLA